MAAATPAIVRELRRVLDDASIPDVVADPYLADETEARVSSEAPTLSPCRRPPRTHAPWLPGATRTTSP
jgi:hypothetical protein